MTAVALPRRPFGRTGLTVSALGLAGSYGIDADSTERAFHELSINYFFLTPRMKGLVEGVRRLIRAGHRDELVIASGINLPAGFAVESKWRAVTERLGTDHLDVFQVFWVRSRWYFAGKTWPALEALRRDGRVRALGMSCHDRPLAAALAKERGLDMLMLRYNAAHRGAEREIFAPLGADRPAVVSYTATRWGRLLKPAQGLGPMTAAECYRFALSNPAVDVALTGPKDWAQLRANAEGAALGPLSPERLEEVRKFGDAVRATAAGRIGFG